MAIVIHSDSGRPRPGLNRAVLRFDMPASVLFCLKGLGKSRHKSITQIILHILWSGLQVRTMDHGYEYSHRIGRRTPSQQLDKYFLQFYPYHTQHLSEDKAINSRSFHLVVTSTSLLDNTKNAALMYMLTFNDFVVQILSYFRVISQIIRYLYYTYGITRIDYSSREINQM